MCEQAEEYEAMKYYIITYVIQFIKRLNENILNKLFVTSLFAYNNSVSHTYIFFSILNTCKWKCKWIEFNVK